MRVPLVAALMLLAGCSQGSTDMATEAVSTTQTTPPPPAPLLLRQFEGCQISYPDGAPVPCAETLAGPAEAAAPEGWVCIGGSGTVTLWSGQAGMGLRVDFADAPVGVAMLDARLVQEGTSVVTARLGQGGFVRLPAPSPGPGLVEVRVWDFVPAQPYPGFAVHDTRFQGEPWYHYQATFNGTAHHFRAHMGRLVVDDRTVWGVDGSLYEGLDFRLEVAPQLRVGLLALPFGGEAGLIAGQTPGCPA